MQGDLHQINVEIKELIDLGINSVGLHFVDECGPIVMLLRPKAD